MLIYIVYNRTPFLVSWRNTIITFVIKECNSIIISFHPSDSINAEECRKIFRSSLSQCKVCLTTDFPESKKLYQKIMKCQAVVLCVSKAFMADKKCRKGNISSFLFCY